ncbi:L,D-transpeptidase family protein [Shewanella sp. 10N.286.48.A6]|uniref:L,D-transpeptidase family protein n=1 Tax=Shewanella sp. 10N.286.48.A6 TaxID=1880833 RepID=UPI000C85FB28|nr:L,D-transpeptidase family protein [Shewanella sp. 10N.286.48.A6]PMH99298.1 peptidoglycan-binding protein [Shewanella sp. 10N.286.48.A6]
MVRCCFHRVALSFAVILFLYFTPMTRIAASDAVYNTLAQHVLLISLTDSSVQWQAYLTILRQGTEAEKLEYIDTIQNEVDRFWADKSVELQYRNLASNASLQKKVFSLEPPVDDYLRVLNHIRRLMWLDNRHEWQPIVPGGFLRPGDSHQTISAISQRLWLLGDLSSRSEAQHIYDDTIANAVVSFQQRHGLKADAVIGPNTLHWLNQTPKQRAILLASNFVAKTSYQHQLSERYLLVNIPAFEMVLVNDSQIAMTSRVIVGKAYRRTPVMSGQISNVVINPTWTVPKKLLRRDILPKVAKDGDYFRDRQFDVFDRAGIKIDKTADEWQMAATAAFPYRLVQRPGEINALGRYKFHFKNDLNIYLHDTPDKWLFNKANRALSSGCIRIEKVQQLAEWFADNVVIDKRTWARMQSNQKNTQWFSLSKTIPVHIVYWNAWVGEDNLAQYRNDIYHLNNTDKTVVANNATSPLQLTSR